MSETWECTKLELMSIVLNSSDPIKTANTLLNILGRARDGESMESIAVSYGLDWEEVANGDRCSL